MKKEVISKFKEKPKTKTAWWAMGLGLATIIWGVFQDRITGPVAGFASIIFTLILMVSALVTSAIALKKGERSWALWVGFVPAILVGAFLVVLIIGEFIFPH